MHPLWHCTLLPPPPASQLGFKRAERQPSGNPRQCETPCSGEPCPQASAPCYIQVRLTDAGEGSLARAQSPPHAGPLGGKAGGDFSSFVLEEQRVQSTHKARPGFSQSRSLLPPRSRRRSQTCQRHRGTARSSPDAASSEESGCEAGAARSGTTPEPPAPGGSAARAARARGWPPPA